MNIPKFKEQLLLHEGFRSKPYKDSVGIWTIGIGRNLQHNPISRSERGKVFGNSKLSDEQLWDILQHGVTLAQAYDLLESDIDSAIRYTKRLSPNFDALSDPRQHVLVDMMFNLGYGTKRRSFQPMLDMVGSGDYIGAVKFIQRTKYARQVGMRDNRLCVMLIKDIFHDQVKESELQLKFLHQ